MNALMIKSLPKGTFFKFTESSSKVYVRGAYIPELKKYECYLYEDVNHFVYLKGTRYVYTDFVY